MVVYGIVNLFAGLVSFLELLSDFVVLADLAIWTEIVNQLVDALCVVTFGVRFGKLTSFIPTPTSTHDLQHSHRCGYSLERHWTPWPSGDGLEQGYKRLPAVTETLRSHICGKFRHGYSRYSRIP